jgi:hypothetical protein
MTADPIRARIAAVLQPELCRWIGTAGLEVSRTLADVVAEALALQQEWGSVVGYQKPAGHRNHAVAVSHVETFRALAKQAGLDGH